MNSIRIQILNAILRVIVMDIDNFNTLAMDFP